MRQHPPPASFPTHYYTTHSQYNTTKRTSASSAIRFATCFPSEKGEAAGLRERATRRWMYVSRVRSRTAVGGSSEKEERRIRTYG